MLKVTLNNSSALVSPWGNGFQYEDSTGNAHGISANDIFQALTNRGHEAVKKTFSTRAYVEKNQPEITDENPVIKDVIEYCEEHQLPVYLGPNIQGTLAGCVNASEVRRRVTANAEERVMVYDEMKSRFYKYTHKSEPIYVMVHCRGNRKVKQSSSIAAALRKLPTEVTKLKKISRNEKNQEITEGEISTKQFKSSFQLVSEQELKEQFGGLEHGMISPLIEAHRGHFARDYQGVKILHIFDDDLRRTYGSKTVTTNANHPEVAMEFPPGQFIDAFSEANPNQVCVAEIVQNGPSEALAKVHQYKATCMGVIGYGEGATLLFRNLVRKYRNKILGQLKEEYFDPEAGKTKKTKLAKAGTYLDPHIIEFSEPSLEDAMGPKGSEDDIANLVDHCYGSLVSSGANMIVTPCNIIPKHTTNYCGDHIQTPSISDAVNIRLQTAAESEGLGAYKLLGGKKVSDSDTSVYPDWVDTNSVLSETEIESLDTILFDINNGKAKEPNRALFNLLKGKELDSLVIAGTSLSVLFHKQHKKLLDPRYFNDTEKAEVERINAFACIDTLDVYARYCAERLFQTEIPEAA